MVDDHGAPEASDGGGDGKGKLARAARLNPQVAGRIYGDMLSVGMSHADAVHMTVQAMQRGSETRALSEGRPVRRKDFSRSMLLAIDSVTRAQRLEGRRWFAAMRQRCRSFVEWTEHMVQNLDAVLAGATLEPRDADLLGHWLALRSTWGRARKHKQFLHAAGYAHAVLNLPDDPSDRAQTLALVRQLRRGGDPGLFVGRNGDLLLSPRQLRDDVARALEAPRKNDRPREVPLNDAPEPVSDPRELDELIEVLDAAEAVAAVQTWSQERQRNTKKGSHRWIVLEHFPSLITRATSLRELAEMLSKSKTALTDAFKRERAAWEAFRRNGGSGLQVTGSS